VIAGSPVKREWHWELDASRLVPVREISLFFVGQNAVIAGDVPPLPRDLNGDRRALDDRRSQPAAVQEPDMDQRQTIATGPS